MYISKIIDHGQGEDQVQEFDETSSGEEIQRQQSETGFCKAGQIEANLKLSFQNYPVGLFPRERPEK